MAYREQYLTEEGEIMGLAQILRQEGRQEGRLEGRQEGRQEGRLEGRQEGEAAMLLRLLEKRFGVISDDIRRQVLTADADTLLLWSERVLTSDQIDQIVP